MAVPLTKLANIYNWQIFNTVQISVMLPILMQGSFQYQWHSLVSSSWFCNMKTISFFFPNYTQNIWLTLHPGKQKVTCLQVSYWLRLTTFLKSDALRNQFQGFIKWKILKDERSMLLIQPRLPFPLPQNDKKLSESHSRQPLVKWLVLNPLSLKLIISLL